MIHLGNGNHNYNGHCPCVIDCHWLSAITCCWQTLRVSLSDDYNGRIPLTLQIKMARKYQFEPKSTQFGLGNELRIGGLKVVPQRYTSGPAHSNLILPPIWKFQLNTTSTTNKWANGQSKQLLNSFASRNFPAVGPAVQAKSDEAQSNANWWASIRWPLTCPNWLSPRVATSSRCRR